MWLVGFVERHTCSMRQFMEHQLCTSIRERGKYGGWESPRRSSFGEGFLAEVVSGLSSERGAEVTLLVGNYICHAQAWHLERNIVRWG